MLLFQWGEAVNFAFWSLICRLRSGKLEYILKDIPPSITTPEVFASGFWCVRLWMLRNARKGLSMSFTGEGDSTSSYFIMIWSLSCASRRLLRNTTSPTL